VGFFGFVLFGFCVVILGFYFFLFLSNFDLGDSLESFFFFFLFFFLFQWSLVKVHF